jgi:hypothetical protein
MVFLAKAPSNLAKISSIMLCSVLGYKNRKVVLLIP